jgi:hypothetical protein
MRFNNHNRMKWILPVVLCAFSACGAQPNTPLPKGKRVAPGVLAIGRISNPRITESSGVVVSRKDPDVLWTHNDGGGKRQVLYAISRTGLALGEYHITGALLEDWEDIAIDGQGHLFLGDIGDNDRQRSTIAVHQIDEPELTTSRNGIARVTRSWNLRYPKGRFNAEALLVWGENGYLITKVFDDARAELYRFSLTNSAEVLTLHLVGELHIEAPVTGADISADGKMLAVVSKAGAYVYRIGGDPMRATVGKPYRTKFDDAHIEACTFVPEGLLATSEARLIFLFTDEPFRTGPPAAEKKKK